MKPSVEMSRMSSVGCFPIPENSRSSPRRPLTCLKVVNLDNRRIGIGRIRQFRPEQKLGHAHGLIEKNLFLVFVALPPFQNIFKRNHRRLKFEHGLQEERVFERRNRASSSVQEGLGRFLLTGRFLCQRIVANLNHGERNRRSGCLRIFQKPAQKNSSSFR